ncbi:histidine kinase [Bifidobacterium rousetti]|nr:histidine kinase [Bifidobacterium rousetti]
MRLPSVRPTAPESGACVRVQVNSTRPLTVRGHLIPWHDGRRPAHALALDVMNGWMERLAEWNRGHVLAVDILLAALLTGLCFPLSGSTDTSTTPGLLFATSTDVLYLWASLTVIPLAMRRWRPEAAAWLFVALCAAHLVLGPATSYSDFYALLMLYSVLVHGSPGHAPRFIVAAFIMGAVASVVWSLAFNLGPLFGGATLADALGLDLTPVWPPSCRSSTSGVFGGDSDGCVEDIGTDAGLLMIAMSVCLVSAIIMAFWRRSRLATLRAMRERNESIAAREDEERRIAALAERARIARDMHDVVAHTLSTIIIQSDGGRYAGTHDIGVAKRTMTTIRGEASHAQRDMHRLFEVFGGPVDEGYAHIPNLFGGHPPVDRRVEGDVRPERFSPDADIAVFRLVQESLSNVRKHAGPGARVTIDETWGSDSFRIVIHDDGVGARSSSDGHRAGYGLLGMRERVTAVGGDVESGPAESGGFTVSATIPLRPALPAASAAVDAVDASDAGETHDPAPRRAGGFDPAVLMSMAFNRWMSWRPRPSVPRTDDDDMPVGDAVRSNWIGYLSWWTGRHYLFMDVLTAAVLTWMLHTATFNESGLADAAFAPEPVRRMMAVALTAVLLTPFALRRRFPESAALAMAVLSAMVLLCLSSIPLVCVFALASVHAAVLYGRDAAWRWVLVAAAVDSWLLGLRLMAGSRGEGPLVGMMYTGFTGVDSLWGLWGLLRDALPAGALMMLLCLASMAMAAWRRSSGSDMLVLRQREKALRAEEERQRVLAANMERERIGAAMRSEVASTLDAVIAKADEGLAMLDGSPKPSAERIAASFAGIGAQGREALSHMRRLLTVLRETGFSEDRAAPGQQERHAAPLSPAAPLDEQLGMRGRTAD